jgi:hypothetical protein
MENDNINKILLIKDILGHIHISEEYMNSFENPHTSNKIFSKYINLLNYNKIITLEMLIKNNELETLIKSLLNFVEIYGIKKYDKSLLYFKQLYF